MQFPNGHMVLAWTMNKNEKSVPMENTRFHVFPGPYFVFLTAAGVHPAYLFLSNSAMSQNEDAAAAAVVRTRAEVTLEYAAKWKDLVRAIVSELQVHSVEWVDYGNLQFHREQMTFQPVDLVAIRAEQGRFRTLTASTVAIHSLLNVSTFPASSEAVRSVLAGALARETTPVKMHICPHVTVQGPPEQQFARGDKVKLDLHVYYKFVPLG